MDLEALTNSELEIRPFVSADAKEFSAAVRESVQTVSPWLPWCNAGYTEDVALSWFASCDAERTVGRSYDMGVFDRQTGRVLGGASISELSQRHRCGNIGYWVRQSQQRKGIASQAVKLLCEFGFKSLSLFRLEIVVAVGNAASEAVAMSVGATRECVARNRVLLHGKPADAFVFSLMPGKLSASGSSFKRIVNPLHGLPADYLKR